jgi:hypothetical protein
MKTQLKNPVEMQSNSFGVQEAMARACDLHFQKPI